MIRGSIGLRCSTRHLSRSSFLSPSNDCPSRLQIRGTILCRYTRRSTSYVALGAAPLKSQSSTTTIIVAAAGLISAAAIEYYSAPQPQKPPSHPDQTLSTVVQTTSIGPSMPLPGRPGNLTAEQEQKLKEFWKVVFKVFGVTTSGTEADDLLEEADEDVQATGSPAAAGKEKKKKRNIFKRRKKDKEGKGEDRSSLGSSAADDDKYGQTKEFFEALANNTPEDLHRAFWTNVKHENPDGLLLRFLRARKWDIEKALVMMISTMQWRHKEMHVEEDIVKGGEALSLAESKSSDKTKQKEGGDFISQLQMGKSYVHGVDKEGRPLTVVRVRLHHGGEQTESSIARFTVHTFETTRFMLVPPADTGVSGSILLPLFMRS